MIAIMLSVLAPAYSIKKLADYYEHFTNGSFT
jgi:hypothetical protein